MKISTIKTFKEIIKIIKENCPRTGTKSMTIEQIYKKFQQNMQGITIYECKTILEILNGKEFAKNEIDLHEFYYNSKFALTKNNEDGLGKYLNILTLLEKIQEYEDKSNNN